MAEASLLVILAIVVVSGVVIFKVVSGALKAALILGAIASVVVAVAGGFVVKDAFDLKSGLQSSGGILLFTSDDGKIITSGAFVHGLKSNLSSFTPLGSSELSAFNSDFSKGSLDAVKGDMYLVVIIRESLITSSLPDVIEIEGQKVSKDVVLAQLEMAGPEKKAGVLLGAFGLKVSQDSLFIASAYKSGKLSVYPESLVFKVAKRLPESALKGLSARLPSALGRL